MTETILKQRVPVLVYGKGLRGGSWVPIHVRSFERYHGMGEVIWAMCCLCPCSEAKLTEEHIFTLFEHDNVTGWSST